jgi:hypothetical protein
VYTFSTNRTFSPTVSEIASIYTKATPTITSGTVAVGDRTGDPNRVLFKNDDTVILLELEGGTWVEKFRRVSQLSSFGDTIDLSGNLILIGIPDFRNNVGKIEAWYYDSVLSGTTEDSLYQGWNKVTTTNDDLYWGLSGDTSTVGRSFGLSASLMDGYVYAAYDNYLTTEYNVDYKGNLRLNRIVTSDNSTLIETNHDVKVLETLDSTKFKLFDQILFQWLGCIYDSGTFNQNNATANPEVNIRYKTDVRMRAAAGPIEQATQVRYAGVGFKSETGNRTQYYNMFTQEYEQMPESVAVYNEVPNWPIFPDGNGQAYFQELSANRAALSGIKFAHLSEIPIDLAQYDYNEGNMYIDEFSMQNFLDYKYDVSATFTDFTTPNDRVRIPTRYYKRLGSNYNLTWISYKNSKIYANSDTVTSVLSSSNTIIPMEEIAQLSGGAYDYEYLETMGGGDGGGVLRFVLEAEHKSNIYSIDLINTNLNEALNLPTRTIIQKIVERAIRDFAHKAAPAHTQLWKITWVGS